VRADGRLRVLAVDLPTGVSTDTGAVGGAAVRADHTVATGLLKYGLLLYPGRVYAGELHVAEIGLTHEDLAPLEKTMSDVINTSYARSLLPERPADAHKYTFGKVLVVAGGPQYPGAASLATAGAARVGAGLVCLASGRSAIGGPGRLAEITYLVLPEAEWGALGELAADELLKKVGDYKALLIGPGLGREKPTRRFLERLLGLDAPKRTAQIGFRFGAAAATGPETPSGRPELPPGVLDADALSMLALPDEEEEPAHRGDFFQRTAGETPAEASEENSWWEHLPAGRFVLTPHAGEMARLLGVEKIDSDHASVATSAAARWKQIVVLKGATTVVAHPEGRLLLHDGANPALATAGTGDVLAGAIAGLIAQGLSPFDAAALGVYLHGAAGRLVADDLGDMGALASDLLPRLPLAIKGLRGSKGR
jgi:NAD(P)H-hydrate repair Nnr-like enzyme with NAD(P)H-hydrate dehydratase domain